MSDIEIDNESIGDISNHDRENQNVSRAGFIYRRQFEDVLVIYVAFFGDLIVVLAFLP